MKGGHFIQTEELGRSFLNEMSEENYGSRTDGQNTDSQHGQNMCNGKSSMWGASHGNHTQYAVIA